MLQISSQVLELTGEAVVLARGGRIVYVNPAAAGLLGGDRSGSSVEAVFGPEIAGAQAACFIGTARIRGKSCIIRVTKESEVQAIFFAMPKEADSVLNDAFVYSLRGCMMTGAMATEICRSRAEELDDRELSRGLGSLTQSQFSLNRLLSNMSAVRDYLRGELSFEPVELDLSAFLNRYIDTVRDLRRDVEISFHASGQIFAAADPAHMENLISNLLSNCLLHGKGLSRISVNLIESGEMAVISVSDDGCGMQSQQLHSVFERYRHLFRICEIGAGAGFGLTAVRAVAESHGGTLLLESREGKGTTVRVSLKKNISAERGFRASGESYGSELKSILRGLAGCLSEEYYTERYMD